MTNLKRSMIVDIDLNSTLGSETEKIRPCVIVTNDVYNERVPVIKCNGDGESNKIKGFARLSSQDKPDVGAPTFLPNFEIDYKH